MKALHTLGILSTSYTWNPSSRLLEEFPHKLSTCWLLFLHSGPTHSKPSQLGWGREIVEARSSDAALHHAPSWSSITYKAWRCVLGHSPVDKQNYHPTKHKPDGMAYHSRLLCWPCWLSVPWILNKSQTVSPAKYPHTTPPPPCFTVGTTHAEIIRSPTLRLTKTQRWEPKISNVNFAIKAKGGYIEESQI